jgi:hypothetical protein
MGSTLTYIHILPNYIVGIIWYHVNYSLSIDMTTANYLTMNLSNYSIFLSKQSGLKSRLKRRKILGAGYKSPLQILPPASCLR